MSTTVELVRANERYARLRAAVEQLAAEWDGFRAADQAWLDGPRVEAGEARELPALIHQAELHIADLRALLAAVDS